jgi:DnaJ family protein C protein 19
MSLYVRFHIFFQKMSAVLVGVGVTLAALILRSGIRTLQRSQPAGAQKYLLGGFEPQMSPREAMQILSIDKLTKETLKKQHRSIMLLNHPDRNGSPYLASKINEAKEMLDKRV